MKSEKTKEPDMSDTAPSSTTYFLCTPSASSSSQKPYPKPSASSIADGREAASMITNNRLIGGGDLARSVLSAIRAKSRAAFSSASAVPVESRAAFSSVSAVPVDVVDVVGSSLSVATTPIPVSISGSPSPTSAVAGVPFFAPIEAPAPAGRLDPSFDQALYDHFDSAQAQLTALRAEEKRLQQRIALVQQGLVATRDSIDVAYKLHML